MHSWQLTVLLGPNNHSTYRHFGSHHCALVRYLGSPLCSGILLRFKTWCGYLWCGSPYELHVTFQQAIQHPVRVNQIPRQIPPQPKYLRPWVCFFPPRPRRLRERRLNCASLCLHSLQPFLPGFCPSVRLLRDTTGGPPNSVDRPPFVRRGVYRALLRALQPIRITRVLRVRLPRPDRRRRSAHHRDGHYSVHLLYPLHGGLQVRSNFPELALGAHVTPWVALCYDVRAVDLQPVTHVHVHTRGLTNCLRGESDRA